MILSCETQWEYVQYTLSHLSSAHCQVLSRALAVRVRGLAGPALSDGYIVVIDWL